MEFVLHANSQLTFSKSEMHNSVCWCEKNCDEKLVSTSTTLLCNNKILDYQKMLEFRFFLFLKSLLDTKSFDFIRFIKKIFCLTWKMSTMLQIISNAYFHCESYVLLYESAVGRNNFELHVCACVCVCVCKNIPGNFQFTQKIRNRNSLDGFSVQSFFPRATLLQKHLWWIKHVNVCN